MKNLDHLLDHLSAHLSAHLTAHLTILALLFSALMATPAAAATWYVLPDGNGDEPTIQAALDACAENDSVLAAAGTYLENLVWPATDGIVLVSESGSEETVIDGSERGSVITVAPGLIQVSETTRIEGFTITNGSAESGGGIFCDLASSPTIAYNFITANSVSYAGGGIAAINSSPRIADNEITFNYAGYAGGGVGLVTSSANIEVNDIKNNEVPFGWTGGGGIAMEGSTPRIYDNEIAYTNGGGGAGGIQAVYDSAPTVVANGIEKKRGLRRRWAHGPGKPG